MRGTTGNDLAQLAALIRDSRDELLSNWREQVRELPCAARLDVPTLNDHVPALLEELAVALETNSDETIAQALIEGSPLAHGVQRVADGYDIVEVVAEYNLLRGCVHDLAEANHLRLEGRAFHVLNKVLDGAIGLAVQTFARQRASDVKDRREEYLAFVAHDLRTPLDAMTLAAKLLDQHRPAKGEDPEADRIIRTLQRNAERIETLVAKVLQENTNPEEADDPRLQQRTFELWPVVEDLIRDTHPEADGTGPRLINEVPDGLEVFADAGLLRRVLQNLIGNAIRYAPTGEIRISAEALEGQQMVECRVSDNGAGIPRDLIDKVFDKGESDPDKAGGTGLGLTIVKTFVEAHGGTVRVESEEGKGTTFRFTLPATP